MERAGNLLGVTLRRMRDPKASTAWLRALWPSLLGETMAAHLRLSSCARGNLRIEADSREWMNQAESMKEQLQERVNQAWGGVLVRDLCIELKRHAGRLPYEIDNDHVPFLRKRAKPKP
jgi:predicted nucleic acid-binding Zn ribbon protein